VSGASVLMENMKIHSVVASAVFLTLGKAAIALTAEQRWTEVTEMADLMVNVAAFAWLILSVMFLRGLRKWDKKFSDLYEDLRREIENEFNSGD